MKKRISSFMLTTMFVFGIIMSALSASAAVIEPQVILNQTNDMLMAAVTEDTILAVEEDLAANGTSVEIEMNELINMFKEQQLSCNDPEVYSQLQDLIDSAELLLVEYQLYKDAPAPTLARKASKPTTIVGIAAIVTWFNSKGYYLSSELLIHFRDNTKLDSLYLPTQGRDKISRTPILRTIKNGSVLSGSNAFTIENSHGDLYYALHKFSWKKDRKSNIVTISDRYDFAYNDRYNGLAGTAINFLYLQQSRGELIPFKVQFVL